MNRRTLLLAGAALALSAAAPALAADPVRIGVALSQSGNLGDSGQHYQHGLELWRDQVNARGGLLGRPVEIVMYDDRSDAATAARLYEKLITGDKVDLLVSPWGSAATATASAVAEKHKRVFVNAGGASETIHQRGFRYIFQVAAPISAYVEGIAPVAQKFGLQTLAFVGRDYAAARDMAAVLEKHAAAGAYKIVSSEYFPAGTSDYSSNIAKARQANPDIWVSVGYPNEAIEMVRQFRSSNYLPKLFVHNGVSIDDFTKASGKDGDYAVGMSLYEPTLKTNGNAEFVKAFVARYGSEPGYYSGFSFSGGSVLEAAVKAAGSFDQDKLREALTTLELDTVMGHHKVDPKTGGQVGVKGLLVQVRNGKREIVWPEALKTAEAVVPAPAWSQR
jgi:branched-chain amino acid transport system substrate-binding protein